MEKNSIKFDQIGCCISNNGVQFLIISCSGEFSTFPCTKNACLHNFINFSLALKLWELLRV